ncbi:membrane hypothetical protein [Sphingomonas sp. T1]|nr:membrane hypothetical protein [Sphingomonas sp. T1]
MARRSARLDLVGGDADATATRLFRSCAIRRSVGGGCRRRGRNAERWRQAVCVERRGCGIVRGDRRVETAVATRATTTAGLLLARTVRRGRRGAHGRNVDRLARELGRGRPVVGCGCVGRGRRNAARSAVVRALARLLGLGLDRTRGAWRATDGVAARGIAILVTALVFAGLALALLGLLVTGLLVARLRHPRAAGLATLALVALTLVAVRVVAWAIVALRAVVTTLAITALVFAALVFTALVLTGRAGVRILAIGLAAIRHRRLVAGSLLAVLLPVMLAALLLARADRFALVAIIIVAVEIERLLATRLLLRLGLALFEARAGFAQHAEIMIRELQIIFDVDAVALHLRVARQVLVLLVQLARVAARAAVDAVAGVAATLATTTTAALALTATAATAAIIIVATTATAAGLPVVDQACVLSRRTKIWSCSEMRCKPPAAHR